MSRRLSISLNTLSSSRLDRRSCSDSGRRVSRSRLSRALFTRRAAIARWIPNAAAISIDGHALRVQLRSMLRSSGRSAFTASSKAALNCLR